MYDTKLRDRLWERLEIEEDDEPMWYLLNCVAGSEMELLYQCREVCGNMEDVVKFIVPTVKKTRSHGAKRMVTEHKVKYLGYVFAKLRLCKETYERIQSLDLCRSWMGTVNHKGYRKLPPSPLALNDDEIASFGLEEWVDEQDSLGGMTENDDAILDCGEDDPSIPQVDTEAIKSFLGLKVNDMVKVTARNKFFNEDGVIRRLKDGRIMVRFLTYGTMFEEWLDPSDVRKLTELEALRGLSGPTQPITQRDLDGPAQGRDYFDASSNPDFNRQQLRQGLQRNRRQDRTADRFREGGSLPEQQTNDRNWNWYQEQQKSGSKEAWTAGSGAASDQAEKEWAMGDVESQWSRQQVPQRQQRRNERTQKENRKADEDWSAFVSSATSTPSEKEEDDFFASLMSDLKKDLKNADKEKLSKDATQDSSFFDSLLDQQEQEEISQSARNNNKRERSTPKLIESQEDSLFFDSLLDDLDATFDETKNRDGDDDFFAALDTELEGSGDDDSSNFFTQLESELSYDPNERPKKAKTLEMSSFDEIPATDRTSPSTTRTAATNTPLNSDNLAKCTVPVLKEMLRERGLKLSGTKTDLIDRLIQKD
jgi:transcription antitermination factor NusG